MSTVPANVTTTGRRPFGVSLLSILIMLGGVFDVIGGVLLLFERKDREVLVDLDLTTNQITGYAVGAIVLGIIAILIGLMLRNGSEFARYLVAIVAALRLASLVFTIIRFDAIHWYSAIVPTVVYALVAGYLFFDKDAQAFFDRTRTAL
jgi:hypothetical protein